MSSKRGGGNVRVTQICYEILLRLVLFFLFLYTENAAAPFTRIIQKEEKWLYANPVLESYFPASWLWIMIILLPFLAVSIVNVVQRESGRNIQPAAAAVADGIAASLAITLLVRIYSDK